MSEHAPNLPGEPKAEGLQIVPATAPMRNPWMVAVWPGMAGVAINAGIYLLSKLDMDVFAELETGDLFDVDHVAVKGGLVQPTRKPRQRLFRWIDPKGKRDLVV